MDHLRAPTAVAWLFLSGAAFAQSPGTVAAVEHFETTPANESNNKSNLVEFDAPGAATASDPHCAPYCGTIAFANNDYGAIVGFYTDKFIVAHGFLRTPRGDFTSFDAPGAGSAAGLDQGTVAYSINRWGEIGGLFQDQNNVFHAFVRHVDGSFAIFAAPGAGIGPNQGTLAYNINDKGETAGVYLDANNMQHGFIRSDRKITSFKITSFDPLGSTSTMVCEETCLNDSGVTTGFYYDMNTVVHGFLREPSGALTAFDAPGAGTVAYAGTYASSINREGTIAGYSVDNNNVALSFVRHPDGTFTTFQAPGAGTQRNGGTAAFSINDLGAVTGQFTDANGVNRGFSRFRPYDFAIFDAPHASRLANQGTRPSTNNSKGAVAGWYIDRNSLNHGFVWTPRSSKDRKDEANSRE